MRSPAGPSGPNATGMPSFPDAVIVATGQRLEADAIVTADVRWKGIPRVVVVDGHR
jgi:hypothetical protein